MATLKALEKEIEIIKARNLRVEADKAWETSIIRRVFISVSTYVLIVIFMTAFKVEKPFLSAVIPAVAYLLSTFSYGIIKSWWLRTRR